MPWYFFHNFLKCLCLNFVNFKEEEKRNRHHGARAPFEVFAFVVVLFEVEVHARQSQMKK
jgi:hypothetical protein